MLPNLILLKTLGGRFYLLVHVSSQIEKVQQCQFDTINKWKSQRLSPDLPNLNTAFFLIFFGVISKHQNHFAHFSPLPMLNTLKFGNPNSGHVNLNIIMFIA